MDVFYIKQQIDDSALVLSEKEGIPFQNAQNEINSFLQISLPDTLAHIRIKDGKAEVRRLEVFFKKLRSLTFKEACLLFALSSNMIIGATSGNIPVVFLGGLVLWATIREMSIEKFGINEATALEVLSTKGIDGKSKKLDWIENILKLSKSRNLNLSKNDIIKAITSLEEVNVICQEGDSFILNDTVIFK